MLTPRELQAQLEEAQRALRGAEKEIDRQRKEMAAAAETPEDARALIAAISKVVLGGGPSPMVPPVRIGVPPLRTGVSRCQVRSCSRQASKRRLALLPLPAPLHKFRGQGLLRSTEGASVQNLRQIKMAARIRPVTLRQPRRPPALATTPRHESTPSVGLRTGLHLSGKLGNRRGVNSLAGQTYLTDSLSNTRFLVDTGAALSVIPYAGNRPTAADAPRRRYLNKILGKSP
jgi:hypothetical protein